MLKDAGMVATTSEAIRMIKQNAVKCDGNVVTDSKLAVNKGHKAVRQIGKLKFSTSSVD